ncbi:glycosyltransferase family 2 protein [Tenacibaculum finnmarkense]|nr:glycosyltransferase family 2 protein [Tenacibaculum finnmarkense]
MNSCLKSVYEQTFKDYEIIIVDDGSKEGLDSIIIPSEIKSTIKRIENSGPGIARNEGVKIAMGEYLAFLDSDDLWCDTKLEKQIYFMDKNKYLWSHTSYKTFLDTTNESIKDINLGNIQGNCFNKFLISCPIGTPCIMIKRDLWIKEKLFFSEKMRYGQDYFLWLSIANRYKLGVLPEVLTKVRIRGNNASKKVFSQLYAKAKIWNYIKEDFFELNKGEKIPFYIRIIYRMSSLGYNQIVFLTSNKLYQEFFSKIIYTPIYLYTRLLKVII